MEHASNLMAWIAVLGLVICCGVVFFNITGWPTMDKEFDALFEDRLRFRNSQDVEDDELEDEDEPKEPSWDELAKENLRLRAELVEANKWVPYQQGSLMRWGKN